MQSQEHVLMDTSVLLALFSQQGLTTKHAPRILTALEESKTHVQLVSSMAREVAGSLLIVHFVPLVKFVPTLMLEFLTALLVIIVEKVLVLLQERQYVLKATIAQHKVQCH